MKEVSQIVVQILDFTCIVAKWVSNVAEGLGITFIVTFFVSRSFFQQHKVNYSVEKLGNLMRSVHRRIG